MISEINGREKGSRDGKTEKRKETRKRARKKEERGRSGLRRIGKLRYGDAIVRIIDNTTRGETIKAGAIPALIQGSISRYNLLEKVGYQISERASRRDAVYKRV